MVTCVSGASKDKNAPQRFADEDNSQILTETQQEFKMDLPTDHEITDVTENAHNMCKSLQEYGNTEFDDAFNATQEGYQKIRSSGDTSEGEVAKLEHPKNKRQSKFGKEREEFSAEVTDVWSATMDDMDITSTTCHKVDEKCDIDEILPAIEPEREKECDVTAGEQTRKKNNMVDVGPCFARVLEEVYKHTCWWYELCRDEKCEGCSRQQVWRQQVWPRQWRLLAWCDPRRSAEDRLTPSCKIRLGTNSETSRVSTGKFTLTRHKNRSCKNMEDMYCDNDYINMTPIRCSVLITSESGDELISLLEQFVGRAEQHLPQHVPRAKFGW